MTAPNMHINVSSAWKKVNKAYVNVSGSWKQVLNAYINVGGTWKKFLSASGAGTMPSFRSAGAGSSSGSVPYPAGITSGDSLYAFVMVKSDEVSDGAPPSMSAPSGWTSITSIQRNTGTAGSRIWITGFLMKKTTAATGSESGSLSFTPGIGSVVSARMYCFIGGVNYEGASTGGAAGSGTQVSQASITSTGTQRFGIHFAFLGANTTASDMTGEANGDFTEAIGEYANSSGTQQCQIATMASATTISGGTITFGASGSYRMSIGCAIYN